MVRAAGPGAAALFRPDVVLTVLTDLTCGGCWLAAITRPERAPQCGGVRFLVNACATCQHRSLLPVRFSFVANLWVAAAPLLYPPRPRARCAYHIFPCMFPRKRKSFCSIKAWTCLDVGGLLSMHHTSTRTALKLNVRTTSHSAPSTSRLKKET